MTNSAYPIYGRTARSMVVHRIYDRNNASTFCNTNASGKVIIVEMFDQCPKTLRPCQPCALAQTAETEGQRG